MMFSCVCLVLLAPQEPPDARRLYLEGQYVAAAEAFQAQAAADPDSAVTQYNLGVSLWRVGDLRGAEEAAERYAALPGGGRVDLHRGLLGNVRFAQAQELAGAARTEPSPGPGQTPGANSAAGATPAAPADPIELLQQAVAKARRARDEFIQAAQAPLAQSQIGRNVERALRLVEELEQQLEDAEQQRDQQQDSSDGEQGQQDEEQQQQDQQQEGEQQEGEQEQQQGEQQEGEQQEGEQQEGEQQQGEQEQQQGEQEQQPDPEQGHERPEPQQQEPESDPQQGAERPEPQSGEEQQQPAGQPRDDAPGEQIDISKLSPEQRQRLLEQLQRLDEQLQKIRAQARSRRQPVERDW